MTAHKTTALVTGASSGLGQAFCRQLAERCEVIIAVARREERLQALADSLAGQVEMHCVAADLETVEGVTRTVESLRQQGPVDVLVNNAGFGTFGKFEELTLARQLAMVRLHIDASVELSRAALPFMRELGGGRIINVASLGAFAALKDSAVYGASKAFLVAFSRSLQEEVGDANIRIQCLCPGFVRTEMHDTEGFADFDRDRVPADLWMDADAVVTASLAALDGEQVVVIPGETNRRIADKAIRSQLDSIEQ